MRTARIATWVLLGSLLGAGIAWAGGGGKPPAKPPASPPAPAPTPTAAGVVSGTVKDDEDKPVEGATVRVTRAGEKDARTAATDAKGFYAVRGLAAGQASVEVRAKGRVPARGEVSVPATGVAVFDAVLKPGVRLAGKVVDARGAPVAGARVVAVQRKEIQGPGFTIVMNQWGERGLSGPDGSFELDGLEPGESFVLEARHPRHLKAEIPGLDASAGGGQEGLEIPMEDAAWVTGTVTDAKGLPVSGASVGVAPSAREEQEGPPVFTGTMGEDEALSTDSLGRFLAGGLPAGDARVQARAKGYFPAVADLKGLEAGKERAGVVVKLEAATAAVEGSVVDAKGAPVEGASVEALGADGVLAEGTTDAQGRFRLSKIASREPVGLRVQAEGFMDGEAEGVALGAKDARVELRRLGRLRVKVHGPDGKLLPRVTVACLVDASPTDPGAQGTRGEHEQGADGLSVPLPLGSMDIVLSAPGCAEHTLGTFEVETDQVVEGGTVRLSKGEPAKPPPPDEGDDDE